MMLMNFYMKNLKELKLNEKKYIKYFLFMPS